MRGTWCAMQSNSRRSLPAALRQVEIAHGRANMAMTKQALDGMEIDARLQQMRGKSVAQGVNAATAFDASRFAGGLVTALYR